MTPRRLLEPARLAGASLLRCQDDGRLIDMVRDGQDRAFEAIVARHRMELLRHCRRLLPRGRAEDALQQAFLSAYQAMKADGQASLDLRPWLHRIAHNACLSALRQNGWRHEEIDLDRHGADRPDQVVERRQDLRSTLAAVQALPVRQRDALLLRALEGRSHADIASELGVTGGAVRQLLHRARTTLRAAATALTPTELLYRMARTVWAGGSAPRIAEATAGAGGGATLAKVGAAVLMSGAIAGGAASVPSPIADTDYSARAAEKSDAGEAHGSGNEAASPREARGVATASRERAFVEPRGSTAESRRRSVEAENSVGRRPTGAGDRQSASGFGSAVPEARSESRKGADGDGGDSDPGSGEDSGLDASSGPGSGSGGSGRSGTGSSGAGSGSGSGDDSGFDGSSGSGDDSSDDDRDSDEDAHSGRGGRGSDDGDDDRSAGNSGSDRH